MDVRREFRLFSYADAGENFSGEQPPKTKDSVVAEDDGVVNVVMNIRRRRRKRTEVGMVRYCVWILILWCVVC